MLSRLSARSFRKKRLIALTELFESVKNEQTRIVVELDGARPVRAIAVQRHQKGQPPDEMGCDHAYERPSLLVSLAHQAHVP
jgi:hypothetical protein